MPYRRLPNTDQARLRALEAALEKGKLTVAGQLAFRQLTLDRIQLLYPRFLGAVRRLESAKQNQFQKAREYGKTIKKAKLYVTHFIQVLTLAVIREELKPEVCPFYGLDPATMKIPEIELEQDIIKWGDKIIKGEQQRCMKGGSPIYSPSIALVKVHFESFIDAYRNQEILQNIVNQASEAVHKFREETDALIQQTWDEIEDTFRSFPQEQRRHMAAEYGIQYVYRHSELKKLEADKLQTNLIFN